MRRRLAALLVGATVAAGATVGAARAEDGAVLEGTLKAIRDRGTILIGHRDAAIPFSFLNKAGQPVGFSMDLCRGIAADIAAALNGDLVEPGAPAWQRGVRIVLVPLTAAQRLPKVMAGEVDLECGSTTASAERQKSVAFSPVFFLAGTKLMVPAAGGSPAAGAAPVASYRDLAGRTVVVGAGTTNGAVMKRLAASVSPAITVTEAPGLDVAYDLLAAGRADAFASDDILLSGMAATRPDGRRFRIVGDYLSYEPYAIAYRRDDAAFAALVRGSFERMAREGVLSASYGRWFTGKLPAGETLDLPASPYLTEMFRALGQPD